MVKHNTCTQDDPKPPRPLTQLSLSDILLLPKKDWWPIWIAYLEWKSGPPPQCMRIPVPGARKCPGCHISYYGPFCLISNGCNTCNTGRSQECKEGGGFTKVDTTAYQVKEESVEELKEHHAAYKSELMNV
jgi:hypothetical protein